MRHPLVGQSIIYYVLIWALIISAHILTLKFQYQVDWSNAVIEGFVFNLIIALYGLSLWWAIQFITPKNQGFLSTTFAFFLLIILGSSLINYLSEIIILQFNIESIAYNQYYTIAKMWKYIVAALYISIIVLVYLLLKNTSSLREKNEQELELQNLLKHAELDMLKFQLNPHFIFNSLNSVNSLTLTAPAQAREMVIKLSDFLRGSLGQDKKEKHTLKEELEQMNLYLDIEKVRFGDRLKVDLSVDETLLNLTIPNMILQPLYENAIKYGVYEHLEEVKVETKCKLKDENLIIEVCNNYDSTAAVQKGKGIGLKNVRSRLELIYGHSDLVTLEKSRDWFCIRLVIPQKYEL